MKVGVVGNGLIGHGVAQIFATAGHAVTMVGRSEESLRGALEKIARSLEQFREHGLPAAAGTLERITTTTSIEDVAGAGLVVEAVRVDAGAQRPGLRPPRLVSAPPAAVRPPARGA